MEEQELIHYRKAMFEQFIESLVDSWTSEYEAWDSMFVDGDVTDEDVEWIQDNLELSCVFVKEKE